MWIWYGAKEFYWRFWGRPRSVDADCTSIQNYILWAAWCLNMLGTQEKKINTTFQLYAFYIMLIVSPEYNFYLYWSRKCGCKFNCPNFGKAERKHLQYRLFEACGNWGLVSNRNLDRRIRTVSRGISSAHSLYLYFIECKQRSFQERNIFRSGLHSWMDFSLFSILRSGWNKVDNSLFRAKEN